MEKTIFLLFTPFPSTDYLPLLPEASFIPFIVFRKTTIKSLVGSFYKLAVGFNKGLVVKFCLVGLLKGSN